MPTDNNINFFIDLTISFSTETSRGFVLILTQFLLSYTHSPWIALLEKDVEFNHEIIDLKNKPREFVAKYKQASGGYGSGLVPLLEDGDNLVIESDVVTKYVAQNIDGKGGQGNNLYPNSEEDDALIQSFLLNWQRVTDDYYDVLRATSQKEVEKRQKEFIRSLAVMETLLQEREGAFVLGDEFSHAECISAPWIQRFFVTMPYFRGVDFESDILAQFKCLSRWMKSVCARPSCLESRCPEDEMIAACKRYYVSFVSPGAKGNL